MKIVIVESELYLSQSIASKLAEEDFEVETYSSVKDALNSNGDVYLLSTSIHGQSCMPVVKKFSDKIVILMVSYINNDTVGEPMRQGAQDYIVKPFMIEDLIRKIEHHRKVCVLEKNNQFYESYIASMFAEIEIDNYPENIKLPLIIQTNYTKAADKFVLDLSKKEELPLIHISLSDKDWDKKLEQAGSETLLYLADFDKMKKSGKNKLLKMLDDKLFVLITNNEEKDMGFETIKIEAQNKLYDQSEILTIDEYVQHVVKSFQYKLPDTELSKRLGISRKSLWEKRKKYDLFKKK